MASVKFFDGRTTATNVAGYTTVVAIPAVAGFDIPTLTLAEVEAGTRIDCAIRGLKITPDVKNSQDQFLCDENKVEFAGAIEYSADDLILQAGDPQNLDPFLTSLVRGQTIILGERYGIKSATDFAADQIMNRLTKAEVTFAGWVDPEANDEGKKAEWMVKLAVKGQKTNVTITA
ncbi:MULTISPECIES: phage tail tube protein [unclassified Luteococcus]|uniref:phage tail tube protein n=1 Tax=unclassified Luteococcus TaxID=2639923 RepID=UPI00313CE9FA